MHYSFFFFHFSAINFAIIGALGYVLTEHICVVRWRNVRNVCVFRCVCAVLGLEDLEPTQITHSQDHEVCAGAQGTTDRGTG